MPCRLSHGVWESSQRVEDLQWTESRIRSSRGSFMMWMLWTRQEMTEPSSSGDATKDREDRETLPSGDWVCRTEAWGSLDTSFVDPFFHHVI